MVLVKYGASWCGMCKVLDKQFDKNPPNVKLIKKSCDEDDIVKEAGIKKVFSLPCCILYSDEDCTNEVKRWNGIVKTSVIDDTIANYIIEHEQ